MLNCRLHSEFMPKSIIATRYFEDLRGQRFHNIETTAMTLHFLQHEKGVFWEQTAMRAKNITINFSHAVPIWLSPILANIILFGIRQKWNYVICHTSWFWCCHDKIWNLLPSYTQNAQSLVQNIRGRDEIWVYPWYVKHNFYCRPIDAFTTPYK